MDGDWLIIGIIVEDCYKEWGDNVYIEMWYRLFFFFNIIYFMWCVILDVIGLVSIFIICVFFLLDMNLIVLDR